MVGVGTPTVGGMRTSNWEKEKRLIPTYSDQLISHSYRDEHKHYIIVHPALPSTSTHRFRILSPAHSVVKSTQLSYVCPLLSAYHHHCIAQAPAVVHSSPRSGMETLKFAIVSSKGSQFQKVMEMDGSELTFVGRPF